jgi:hypothetical protein
MDFIQLTLIFTAGAIIKNLSSGDEEKNSQAMKASENFLKVKENIRTKFDKSSITGESKSSPEVRT